MMRSVDSWLPRFPPPDPPAPPGLIGPLPGARELREWPLVLDSMSIPFSLRQAGAQWFIVVSSQDSDRALDAIRLYQAENRDWPPRRVKEVLAYPRSLAAPAVFLALVVFHAITGSSAAGSAWFARGTASSALICHGEPWRAVTALTLHADVLHVVGNALSGSIFLSAVNRRLGNGRGSFFVLLAGALGNLANALWHRNDHLSIGASTAVFAAVGILVATQIAVDRGRRPRTRVERAAPLLGGLALLGMLGASPQADLYAHLFGLAAGLLAGALAALWVRAARPSRPWVQIMLGLVSVVIVVGAWALAGIGRMRG